MSEAVLQDGEFHVSWKGKKYKIPKKDVQKSDFNKTGPETSYLYFEVKLKDGSVIRGIPIEKKDGRFAFKTELGFVELDSSKIESISPSESLDFRPELPDKYRIDDSRSSDFRFGLEGSANASLGNWSSLFPQVYSGGAFLEKKNDATGSFYGFLSDYSSGRGSTGQISIWSQSLYYGKSFGSSSPYFLLGMGASSVVYAAGDHSKSAFDPSALLEFGWNWNPTERSVFRVGIQTQCAFESQDSLCRAGLRLSWGWNL
ncbi:LA_3334 family protein [Leptospira licerasiae]|uniref:LA_3334 family protein n=1 Tax=Leptospira licerasiae TaxID=447106 RepID=UPI003019B15A